MLTKILYDGLSLAEGGVCAPKGFQASGMHCGMRRNQSKKDVALLYSEEICNTAAVYTQNLVKGAPLLVTKQNIRDGASQAMICNSGNANTCNADGKEKAERMCELVGETLDIPPENVIVASTGVIGEVLDITPIERNIAVLTEALGEDGANDAAQAILTTDTHEKEIAVRFDIGGAVCTIGGMAKGSGMIHPNMATMLCFLTTDAVIEQELLKLALSTVVDDTFNMISVDGDTSTNDMVSIMANGRAGNSIIGSVDSEAYRKFCDALYVVLMNLSREIAADGEGATKLLECVVTGAKDKENAKKIAKTVITSNLFKCAMFGGDANWGRVLCAIGYSGAELDIGSVGLLLSAKAGNVQVCRDGSGVEFSEEKAAEIMRADEVKVIVTLKDGTADAVAWGCDLTYDYVKINGDYRT